MATWSAGIDKLPDDMLLKILGQVERECIPRVCKRWNSLHTSPSLWESMHVDLPLDRRGSPPLQWVQTRVPCAKELVLQTHWDQNTTATARRAQWELNNAHSVAVLSHAQPCRLQKLVFGAGYQDQWPTRIGRVLRAIGRFAALTELYLCNLSLDERSLQAFSGLPSLREFRGKGLNFHQSELEMYEYVDGPVEYLAGLVAEALWAAALGWPQLLHFELTNCKFYSAPGEMQTTPNSPLRRLHLDERANARCLVSGISALQDLQQLHISVYDTLGSIGRLPSLTSLVAHITGLADYVELDLHNPELQLLHLTAAGDDGMNEEGQKWRCLSALTSLKSLHLYNFWLPDLPAEVVLLTKLTSLRIDNGLSSMSVDLSPLENLVELRLSCGYISSLPAMLLTCISLEELVLTDCGMEMSSESIGVLKCLPRLRQLTMDIIRYIPAEMLPGIMHQLARELPSVKLSSQPEH